MILTALLVLGTYLLLWLLKPARRRNTESGEVLNCLCVMQQLIGIGFLQLILGGGVFSLIKSVGQNIIFSLTSLFLSHGLQSTENCLILIVIVSHSQIIPGSVFIILLLPFLVARMPYTPPGLLSC